METEILDIFSLEDTEVQPAVEKRFIAEIDPAAFSFWVPDQTTMQCLLPGNLYIFSSWPHLLPCRVDGQVPGALPTEQLSPPLPSEMCLPLAGVQPPSIFSRLPY